MEQLGTDFNATGSVMSRAELEDQRRKRGECVTCGRKCFQKKLFKMIPITDHGRVLAGRCLNCQPLDANDGAIPAVSRPATAQDLARFTRSQNNLRSQSGHEGQSQRPQRRGSHMDRPRGRRSSSRNADPANPRSMRSLGRSSISSQQSHGSAASYDYAGDSGSQRGAIGPHTTGRSTDSIQSAPANTRGQDSGVHMPMSHRPSITRPSSNRSISASSYYSTRSRTSIDSSSGFSHGNEQIGRRLSYEEDTTNTEDYDDYNVPPEEVDHRDLHGQEPGEPAASLDYYHRSYHDRDVSNRSLRSTDSHDTGGISRESGFHREGTLDRGGAIHFDSGGVGMEQHPGNDHPRSRPAQQRRGSIDSFDGIQDRPRQAQQRRGSIDSFDDTQERPRQAQQRRGSIDSFDGQDQQHHAPQRRRSSDSIDTRSLDGISHSYHDRSDFVPRRRRSSVAPGGREGSSRSLDSASASGSSFEDDPPSKDYSHEAPMMDGASHTEDFAGSVRSSNTNGHYSDSGSDDHVLQQLRDAGDDFVQIVNIMRDNPDNIDAQSAGLHLISNMELTAEDSATFTNIGAIQVIIHAMDCFANDLELQIYGCRAIWNASGTTENQRIFVEAGALDYILCAMSNFSENGEIQEQAMAVLANLGTIEENLEEMQEKGVIEKLVEAMNKHASNGQVQVKGCLAMANLASHSTALKKKIVELGGGSAIVISMVMHPNDSEIQEKALRSLRNLSANCDENIVELTNIGGIDAIISAMQVHRDTSSVQEAGAWTLSNLAGNPDSKVLIGDCGGIDVIVRAMWVHSDKVSVQEWCCNALYSLSLDLHNSKMILDVGGISAIVNAMQAHVDSSPVQEMGCAVLCNLASDQPSKIRIVDEEALDAVVLAMVLYSEDGKVQQKACQLLLQLSIAENFKAMQASNVGELVRSAAEKFPDTCAEPAERLIHVIEGFISEYT